MRDYSIEEWNEKPRLSKKLFVISRIRRGYAFFYTECDVYMIKAKLRDDCHIVSKMTAKDVALQSDEITVTKIY